MYPSSRRPRRVRRARHATVALSLLGPAAELHGLASGKPTAWRANRLMTCHKQLGLLQSRQTVKP
jgi:hypothetical protein